MLPEPERFVSAFLLISLVARAVLLVVVVAVLLFFWIPLGWAALDTRPVLPAAFFPRSEERRVGKEC